MITASDLIGSVVCTESGERLGRIHDLRARKHEDSWELVGLVLGGGGIKARLAGSGTDPVIDGQIVPWSAVTDIGDGLVTVRDETEPGAA